MKNEELLFEDCRRNRIDQIKKILAENPDSIDVVYMNGYYFRFAISHNSVEMLNTLLQYFTDTKLQGSERDLDYKSAKYQLHNILQDVFDSSYPSAEIEEILSKYISTNEGEENDTDREADLAEFDDLLELSDNQSNEEEAMLGVKGVNYIVPTEENLMRMNSMSGISSDDSGSDNVVAQSGGKFSRDTKIIEEMEHEFQALPDTEDSVDAPIIGDESIIFFA